MCLKMKRMHQIMKNQSSKKENKKFVREYLLKSRVQVRCRACKEIFGAFENNIFTKYLINNQIYWKADRQNIRSDSYNLCGANVICKCNKHLGSIDAEGKMFFLRILMELYYNGTYKIML